VVFPGRILSYLSQIHEIPIDRPDLPMNWLSPSRVRLLLLAVLLTGAAVVLLARLWTLQMQRRETYLGRIPGASTVTVRVPPTRGRIFDRDQRLLADNVVSYEASFDLEALRKAYADESGETVPTVTYNVAVRDSIQTRRNKDPDIVTIFKEIALPRLDAAHMTENFNARGMQAHFRTHRGLIPWVYRDSLDYEEFARFAENAGMVPGLSVRFRPQRRYLRGALASHLIGYMRKPETSDLPEGEAGGFDHFQPDEIGAAGLELAMEKWLHGRAGRRTLKRDEKGRVLGEIGFEPPERGADLYLTLDAEFQMVAEETMRLVGRGAAVLVDVRNGDVLALASVPSYDPNDFIPRISKDRYDAYVNDPAEPLFCLALNAYEPGSTYKIVSAVAAGLTGQSNPHYTCRGGVQYGNKFKKCWIHDRGGAHGTLGLAEAVQRSCNAYFYLMGNALGEKPFIRAAETLGFGRPTGLELGQESPGIVMGGRYWREVLRREPDRGMSPADLSNMTIGQGETLATPLQICMMTAAIANGGKVLRPRLVRQALAAGGRVVFPDGSDGRTRPDEPVVVADLVAEGLPAATLENVREGMFLAVNRPGGTASRAAIEGAGVCGKTGSAQTTIRGRKGTHAWFTGFTPRENPRYAICVVVLGGKAGGKVAAPLARRILEGVFAVERERLVPGSGRRPQLASLKPAPGNFDAILEIAEDEEGRLQLTLDPEGGPEIRPARVVSLPPATIREAPDEEGMVVRRARPVIEATPE
jgi:penicillin-binding protein 2